MADLAVSIRSNNTWHGSRCSQSFSFSKIKEKHYSVFQRTINTLQKIFKKWAVIMAMIHLPFKMISQPQTVIDHTDGKKKMLWVWVSELIITTKWEKQDPGDVSELWMHWTVTSILTNYSNTMIKKKNFI